MYTGLLLLCYAINRRGGWGKVKGMEKNRAKQGLNKRFNEQIIHCKLWYRFRSENDDVYIDWRLCVCVCAHVDRGWLDGFWNKAVKNRFVCIHEMNNNKKKKNTKVFVVILKLTVVGKPICPLSITGIVCDVHLYGTKIHRQQIVNRPYTRDASKPSQIYPSIFCPFISISYLLFLPHTQRYCAELFVPSLRISVKRGTRL